MKKSLLSIIALVACIFATNSWALKIWMENRTSFPVLVSFASKTGRHKAGPIVVDSQKTKSKDVVFGTSLGILTINNQKIKIDRDGTYWYLALLPRQDGDIDYDLYRVKGSYAAKLAASIAAAPFTAFYSLFGLPEYKNNLILEERGKIELTR